MNFKGFPGPQPLIVDLRAKDPLEAIDELIGHLSALGKIAAGNCDAIMAEVRKREKTMNTVISPGIALPHAITNLVSEAVIAVGRSRQGINFGTKDSPPVYLVGLYLVPDNNCQEHHNTLVQLAKLLGRENFRNP